MFNAAVKLGRLVESIGPDSNPGLSGVYIHDTNAVNEAPGVVIVYLALFLAHPDWEDTEKLRQFVQGFDKHSLPNMYIVNECIKRNKKFQDEQRDRLR